MTTVIKCDVCGKTALSSIAFASVTIDAYQLKSVIPDLHKEACSPSCMAKLLRGAADQMDPRVQCEGGRDEREEAESGFPYAESGKESEKAIAKPGFFSRLFR